MEEEVTELRKQEVDGDCEATGHAHAHVRDCEATGHAPAHVRDCEATGHAHAHVQRASYLNTHDNTTVTQKQEQMAMLLLNGDKT